MWRNLQYGLRQLRRNTFFSSIVVILLAIGIGANTLVFSLVNELLLKPLPVRDPGSLYLIAKNQELQVRPDVDFRYQDFRDIVQKSSLFRAAVAEQEPLSSDILPFSTGNDVRLVMTQMVSPDYFTELGVHAVAGRVLTAEDAANSSTIPAVLSYQFWQSQFAGSRDVVGRTIRLKNLPFLVVGVLPREFHSSDIDRAPDVRVPISAVRLLTGHEVTDPGENRSGGFRILVRLAPGVTPAQVAAALLNPLRDALEANLRAWNARQEKPDSPAELEKSIRRDREFRLDLEPVGRGVSRLRDQFSRALWLLLGGVGLLLLAVCANVAGLLLARSDERRREMGIRLAVGAGRAQLIRQLLTENLLLALPGAVLGALFAFSAAPALVRLLPAARDFARFQTPQLLTVTPDGRVWLFAVGLAAFCVLAFGLVPAWRATALSLHAEMKATGRRGHRGAGAMAPVALQVAFCVVLLAAAVLMLRTFWKLQHLDAGFDRAHIIEFTMDPVDAGYNKAQGGAFYRELESRVAALPGVRSVAFASVGVMRGIGIKTTLAPQGVVLPRNTFLNTSLNNVTTSYFDTMGMPLLTGRNLEIGDADKKPLPIVVNQAFADFFYPRQNPIGKLMGQNAMGSEPRFVIVGLTVTAKYRSMREPDPPTYYDVLDAAKGNESALLMYVRTYGAPAGIVTAVRDVLAKLDPGVPLVETFTVEQEIQASLWQERLVALLAAFFGAVSILLAAIGLYGTLTYSVAQRAHELGIRVAIGAQVMHIVRTVCSPIAIAVACGLAGGGVGAAFLLRLTERLLYGVRPADPVSYGAAVFFVLAFAVAASIVPAWRAARIDPSRALREE
ncbi:MAG TPA: ABC transporter permease [Bryobacteraceae bacterium]